MKNKAYNITCIIVAVLFISITGFIVAAAMGFASLKALSLLMSGGAIFEAFSLLLAGVLFSTIPALLFAGCLMAFIDFLNQISNN